MTILVRVDEASVPQGLVSSAGGESHELIVISAARAFAAIIAIRTNDVTATP